jgi:hypothetical protein
MDYKLYTLVDITHTKQYRQEHGKEQARLQEQNFNTVLHTLGLRSNIYYAGGPRPLEVKGSIVGFDTDDIIRVWRFDWSTERTDLYEVSDDPVAFLKQDFHLVPYIAGLNELMQQKYAVFNTALPGPNIVFHLRQ